MVKLNMKKRLRLHTFQAFLIVITCSLFSQSHANDELVLTYAKDSAYQLMAKSVLSEAYRQLDINLNYEKLPSLRSPIYVETGAADGLLARSVGVKAAHPNLIMIPVAISYDVISVYSKNHDIKIEGWDSLKPYSIGYVTGSTLIEEKTQGMKAENVSSEIQGLYKLNLGRNDIFIGLSGTQCLIHQMELSEIKSIDPPLETVILFHFLNAKHKELAVNLEKILKQMKHNGQIETLQKQAFLEFMNQC